jgi:glycosyltransferase involved in cell wall biosynthesis
MLVERLQKSGIRVHIIRSLKREIAPLYDIKAFINLYRIIKKNAYDIVHCHSGKAGFLGRVAAWCARVPRIYFTVHGWSFYSKERRYYPFLISFVEKIMAPITTKIICVSENDRKQAILKKVAKEEKLIVIKNGSSAGNFLPSVSLRVLLKAEKEDVIFGMIGRLAYPKNPLLFLKAFKCLLKKCENVKCILIGDGPLYKECRAFIGENSLEGKVFLLGFREDARALLHEMDVFVLISQFEGLPLTIIEAMHSALPIIATDVGGIRELVKNGINGFLIPEDDEERLFKKMQYLAKNLHARYRMGRESQKIAKKEYALEKMVEAYEDLYKEV